MWRNLVKVCVANCVWRESESSGGEARRLGGERREKKGLTESSQPKISVVYMTAARMTGVRGRGRVEGRVESFLGS